MIRPTNINIEEHTADFKCDEHGGSVETLNLNTDAAYSEDKSVIIVDGAKLSPACNCVTFFPTSNGNEDAQAIAQAKTE